MPCTSGTSMSILFHSSVPIEYVAFLITGHAVHYYLFSKLTSKQVKLLIKREESFLYSIMRVLTKNILLDIGNNKKA